MNRPEEDQLAEDQLAEDRLAEDELVRAAEAAAANAYVPASGFGVGAALRSASGRLFTGCNVENSSFGLTVCAERNALFAATAAGERDFAAIAIYTPLAEPGYPCGACRQVLVEFAEDLRVVLCGDGDARTRTSLAALIPHAFRFGYRNP